MVDVYYPGVFTKHTIHIGFVQQCGTGKAQWKYICVFDVHLVTQAQPVHKLLHHLRLKRRDFYSTVRFMICNKHMLAEVICHVIPHLMLHNTFDSMIIPITNQPINQETSSINVFIHQSTATVYRFYQDTIHLDHMSK